MAKVLDNFVFPERVLPTKRKMYPFQEWLDGKARRLFQGEDFHCKPASIRNQIFKAAKDNGRKIRTMIQGSTLVIQGYDATSNGHL